MAEEHFTKCGEHMLSRMQGKGKPPLLVGVQSGRATVEVSVAVPQTGENRSITRASSATWI